MARSRVLVSLRRSVSHVRREPALCLRTETATKRAKHQLESSLENAPNWASLSSPAYIIGAASVSGGCHGMPGHLSWVTTASTKPHPPTPSPSQKAAIERGSQNVIIAVSCVARGFYRLTGSLATSCLTTFARTRLPRRLKMRQPPDTIVGDAHGRTPLEQTWGR